MTMSRFLVNSHEGSSSFSSNGNFPPDTIEAFRSVIQAEMASNLSNKNWETKPEKKNWKKESEEQKLGTK